MPFSHVPAATYLGAPCSAQNPLGGTCTSPPYERDADRHEVVWDR